MKHTIPSFLMMAILLCVGCNKHRIDNQLTLKWNPAIDSLMKVSKNTKIDSLRVNFTCAKSDTSAINAINDYVSQNWTMVFLDSIIEVIALDGYDKSIGIKYDYGETDAIRNLGKIKLGKNDTINDAIADSLFQLSLNNAKQFGFKDLQIKALQAIGMNQPLKKHQDAVKHLNEAIQLAKELKQDALTISVLSDLGAVYYPNEKPNALDMFLQALELARKTGAKDEIYKSLNWLSMIYQDQKEYDKAISYNFERLEIAKGDTPKIEESLQSLADVYTSKKDYKNALNCLIQIETLSGDSVRGFTLLNIGEVYENAGDYSNAIIYYKRGIEKNKKENKDYNFRNINIITYQLDLIQLAETYCKINKCSEADKCLKEVFADKAFNVLRANYYPALAEVQFCKHNFIGALQAADSAMVVANERGYWIQNKVSVYELLTRAYDTLNMPSKAYLMYRKYTQAKDSLHEVDNAKKFSEVEAKANDKLLKAEQDKKNLLAAAELARQKIIRDVFFASAFVFIIFSIMALYAYRQKRKDNQVIAIEKANSDTLLKNILPSEIAEELKARGKPDAKLFDEVTVLYTDFKDFTTFTDTVSPKALVAELDNCFNAFDEITSRYNIEKIKTVGDAYIAVSGLPLPNVNHAEDVINAAIEIREFILKRRKELGDKTFEIRIGVHSGSVVAGIVGVKKFAYDIWGDTVNTAARLEQNSETGKINISETTYQLVKDKFNCQYRGEIEAKNKGKLKMYFVK